MPSLRFGDVGPGGQLGNLEYLIDDAALRRYQRWVGDAGRYANLIAGDCESMVVARLGELGWTTRWSQYDLLRPPVPGRRIQVGAWLKEAREIDGSPQVRVSAFAVDEIGTEILRSEAALAVGTAVERLDCRPVESPRSHGGGHVGGLAVEVGETLPLDDWNMPDVEQLDACRQMRRELTGMAVTAGGGETQLLAGWLEGQVGKILGDDFRWGGRLALAFRAPLAAGDRLAADAVVIRRDEDHMGTRSVALVVNVSNSRNQSVAVGQASATMPSPRLL